MISNVKDGKIVYSQMLNKGGGIESDLTVTRIEKNIFLFFEHDASVELCSLEKSNRGIRLNKKLRLSEI